MALADAALDNHGEKIERAKRHDIEAERVGGNGERWIVVEILDPLVAAEDREFQREGEQQRRRDQHRPHRHVDAEDRAADIFVTRAWIDIEQRLPHRNHQQQHREDHADPGGACRKAVAQTEDEAEGDRKSVV